MSREKEKEEKIFQAIGDLPEDMIADAASYQLPEKETGYLGKLVLMGKGFACAACAALLIFGLGTWVYNIYRGGSLTKTENMMIEGQQSGASYDMSETGEGKEEIKDTVDNATKHFNGIVGARERKKGTLYLWTEGVEEVIDTKKDRVEVGDSEKTGSTGSEKERKSSVKKISEGKTIQLYVKDISVEGKSGTGKKILPLIIGKEGDGITYTICSALSNCSVSSIINGNKTKQIGKASADCIGGDRVELNTFENTVASWTENPAPEWEGKDIKILDVIEITGEKEGEVYDFGEIVIGKKGGNYYGLLQKGND